MVVPDGDYNVNVTGTSTTTGLSVVNNTETITVNASSSPEKVATVTRNLPDYVNPDETFTVTLTQVRFLAGCRYCMESAPGRL